MLSNTNKILSTLFVAATLTACGGSQSSSIDANKLKPKPDLQKSKYQQGVYLVTLATDEGDLDRDTQNQAKYLGNAFVLSEKKEEMLMANVANISAPSLSAPSEQLTALAKLTVGASKNGHELGLEGFLCREQASCGYVSTGRNGYADVWLRPLSDVYASQIKSTSFSHQLDLSYQEHGLVIKSDLKQKVLMLKVATKNWPEQQPEEMAGIWQADSKYTAPAKYNHYQFTVDESNQLSLQASIADNGHAYCTITASPQNQQGDIREFYSKGMSHEQLQHCLSYISGSKATRLTKEKLRRVIHGEHSVLASLPATQNGTQSLAVMHIVEDQQGDNLMIVGSNGWLKKDD